jgi:hypothetical protein
MEVKIGQIWRRCDVSSRPRIRITEVSSRHIHYIYVDLFPGYRAIGESAYMSRDGFYSKSHITDGSLVEVILEKYDRNIAT